MQESLDKTKLSRVQKVLDSIRAANVIEEDPDVTFEYLVGSCFPTIFQNVQSALNEEHTLGYMEGYKDGQKLISKEKPAILN